MAARRVGAAVVHDPDGEGVGILTERDVLASVGSGQDPDVERVRDHLTGDLVYAAPTWTLEQAADAMVRGGFRHLVVLDAGEVAGILSVRDIVRCWIASAPQRRAGRLSLRSLRLVRRRGGSPWPTLSASPSLLASRDGAPVALLRCALLRAQQDRRRRRAPAPARRARRPR